MKKDLKSLLVFLAVPLAVGALAGFLNGDGINAFGQLVKPPLSPPGWIFPVVWSLLYLLMGLASWLVFSVESSPSEQRDNALRLYGVQLAVNFLWPFLFFQPGWFFAAFAWLLLLWYLVFRTVGRFRKISKPAGRLMLPYLLWITFAGYLNFGIAVLN